MINRIWADVACDTCDITATKGQAFEPYGISSDRLKWLPEGWITYSVEGVHADMCKSCTRTLKVKIVEARHASVKPPVPPTREARNAHTSA